MDSAERFKRIDELFRAAGRLPPDERIAYLAEQCGDDDALRREVEALLSEDDSDTGLLDRPALGSPISFSRVVAENADAAEVIPERIGNYRIVARLGSGGMGTVYEAEQDNPRRTVALKVINAGVASPSVLRRFEHEAQLLGKLQHPGIAQIFEAGMFDVGAGAQPYFAMELIRGEPLTRYADEHKLGTRQRLHLVSRISEAVHHAHQRGIIHRDLKPGNIIVDETGQPRILDFGVARATDADLQTTTLRIDIGQLIGTIPYMSPEQAGGDPDDLDTRSDVYVLGVLAYQLRKFAARNTGLVGGIAAVFIALVGGLTGTSVAWRSAVEAREEERQQRSEAVAQRDRALAAETLADDRRKEAEAARERAEAIADMAHDVNHFLNIDLLGAVRPDEQGIDVTVREVLDEAAKKVEGRFPDQPIVEASLRNSIGTTYWKLGRYADAEPHLAPAIRTRWPPGADSPVSTRRRDASTRRKRRTARS